MTPDLRVYSCAFSAFWQDRRAVRAVVTPGSRSSGERGDLAIFPGIGRKFDALRNRRTSDVGDGSIASVGLSWHVGFTPDSGRIAITVFKYRDTAMKAMTENPQDRGAAAAKLAEAFGGKMEAAYWFSSAGDYDGMVVWLLPNDQATEALNMMTRASGNFSRRRGRLIGRASPGGGKSRVWQIPRPAQSYRGARTLFRAGQ